MQTWRSSKPLLAVLYTRCSLASYSTLRTPSEINEALSKPTWSVRETLFRKSSKSTDSQIEKITRSQLHHLLRLSALPLPSSQIEEDKLIKDLQRQLEFVRSIQAVDTEGVEPLIAIRDETRPGRQKQEIGLDDPEIERALGLEKRVGKRGRIVSVRENAGKGMGLEWDPLAQAGRKTGQYIAVDTAKD